LFGTSRGGGGREVGLRGKCHSSDPLVVRRRELGNLAWGARNHTKRMEEKDKKTNVETPITWSTW